MAFIAMVFAAMYIVIIIVGLFILTIGIVLDIIWGVRKKKQKKLKPRVKRFVGHCWSSIHPRPFYPLPKMHIIIISSM